METDELRIQGAYAFTPTVHDDDRGSFHEWFRADTFRKAVGHDFNLAQANSSVSSAGTLRGIHFAELPPSQAKYVSCVRGAILDVVVDLRLNSATYGEWEAVELSGENRTLLYLTEGLGHAFIALEDDTIVNYLCSAPYAPGREHGINPFDETIDIDWPTSNASGRPLAYRVSEKDAAAPSLPETEAAGLLPTYEEWQTWRSQLS